MTIAPPHTFRNERPVGTTEYLLQTDYVGINVIQGVGKGCHALGNERRRRIDGDAAE